ncbi:MAG TPA: serine/threonine-protein kinase [Bryobacteraceae bacterium]|nr:serine/threonine-protein kinase [Bryobacteraceae bacterium]
MGFELGRTYSGYEFLDHVNQSKNIIAYRVRNTLTQRQELLHILPQGAQDEPQRVERFTREMRVRAGLCHPHIAALYNAAEIEGELVMTTELVEGPTLAELLATTPIAWREAVAIVRQALAALAYAHDRDVIHRDINPENIIISPGGVLKLTNFGMAKLMHGPQLTQSGTIMGNLKYIAPEQVRGGVDLDARSDIYSLGIVLYEMLCGAPPFDSKSEFELMMAHVNNRPPRPSLLDSSIPRALDEVVLKALAKDPADRYQNAREFDEALEEAVRPPAEEQPAAEQPRGAAALLSEYKADQRASVSMRWTIVGGATAGVCVALLAIWFAGGW